MSKMAEYNSVEYNSHEIHNIHPNLSATLSNEEQSRLSKANEINNCFVAEIKERKIMSKKLTKYVASFDYFDKSLIVLFVTTGSISIASFATAVVAPVGMMSASCSPAFSITTGIVKKLLKTTRNKKKNTIKLLCQLEVNKIAQKVKYLNHR